MKKIGFLILLSLLLFSSFSFADLINDDEKPISACFRISNIDSFPSYDFYAVSNIYKNWENTTLLTKDTCLSFYKLDAMMIFAAPKNYAIPHIDIVPAPFPINDTNLIIANIEITLPSFVDKSSPIASIEKNYTITKLNENEFVLSSPTTINKDISGNVIGNTPPSPNPNPNPLPPNAPSNYPYIVGVLVFLLIVIVGLIIYRMKKR